MYNDENNNQTKLNSQMGPSPMNEMVNNQPMGPTPIYGTQNLPKKTNKKLVYIIVGIVSVIVVAIAVILCFKLFSGKNINLY